jgi:hypothetical protein
MHILIIESCVDPRMDLVLLRPLHNLGQGEGLKVRLAVATKVVAMRIIIRPQKTGATANLARDNNSILTDLISSRILDRRLLVMPQAMVLVL